MDDKNDEGKYVYSLSVKSSKISSYALANTAGAITLCAGPTKNM